MKNYVRPQITFFDFLGKDLILASITEDTVEFNKDWLLGGENNG